MTAHEGLLLAGGLVLDPDSGKADRRDILIENGKIVGLTQSFLWN